MTDSPLPNPTTARELWADYLRGILIFLVVFGHVLGGLNHRNITTSPELDLLYEWIYAFHMPAFFFLSGVFAIDSFRRHRLRRFAWNRFSRVAWPYLLWTTILWIGHLQFKSITNMQPIPWLPVVILYSASDGMWFLYALFVASILMALIEQLRIQGAFLVLSTLLFAAGHFGWLEFWDGLKVTSQYAIYLAIGSTFSEIIRRLCQKVNPIGAGIVGALALGIVWVGILTFKDLHYTRYGPILALPGIVGITGIALMFSWRNQSDWLLEMGEYSLQIYVMHPATTVLAREILRRSIGNELAPRFLLEMCAAIFIPLWIARTCAWLRIPFLFSLDWPPKKLPKHSAESIGTE